MANRLVGRECLYATDTTGAITFVNERACQLLGHEEATLLGRRPREVLGDAAPPAFRDATRPVGLEVADGYFIRADGSRLPVAFSCSPRRGAGAGGGSGAVVVFREAVGARGRVGARERVDRREIDSLTWLGRIRAALEQDRMLVYSQPIHDLPTGRRCSQELLIRMRGLDGSIIPPASFLPAAERWGIIREIDAFMIARAARVAARGDAVSVNISAGSFGDPFLLAVVESQLASSAADPGLITFEITETTLMGDLVQAADFARRLTALGCQLALDDFGTGFGGFTHLKKLPIARLKIDREFISDLVFSAESQEVVRAIADLARRFGVKTIAEGVEDEATLSALKDFQVDMVQGYHLGRPAPLAL